jgi:hypothetical protein
MRIDFQIAAHLRQEVASDFFLPILEGREFFAEVQAPMATLTFVAQEFAGNLPAPRQPLYPPLEFRTLHASSVGQMCPNVKWEKGSSLLTLSSDPRHSLYVNADEEWPQKPYIAVSTAPLRERRGMSFQCHDYRVLPS